MQNCKTLLLGIFFLAVSNISHALNAADDYAVVKCDLTSTDARNGEKILVESKEHKIFPAPRVYSIELNLKEADIRIRVLENKHISIGLTPKQFPSGIITAIGEGFIEVTARTAVNFNKPYDYEEFDRSALTVSCNLVKDIPRKE